MILKEITRVSATVRCVLVIAEGNFRLEQLYVHSPWLYSAWPSPWGLHKGEINTGHSTWISPHSSTLMRPKIPMLLLTKNIILWNKLLWHQKHNKYCHHIHILYNKMSGVHSSVRHKFIWHQATSFTYKLPHYASFIGNKWYKTLCFSSLHYIPILYDKINHINRTIIFRKWITLGHQQYLM